MREKREDAGKIGSFESAARFSSLSKVVKTTRGCIQSVHLYRDMLCDFLLTKIVRVVPARPLPCKSKIYQIQIKKWELYSVGYGTLKVCDKQKKLIHFALARICPSTPPA